MEADESLYEAYEAELTQAIAHVRELLAADPGKTDVDDALHRLTAAVSEAEDVMESMDLAMRSVDTKSRMIVATRHQGHHQSLLRMKAEVSIARERLKRVALLGADEDGNAVVGGKSLEHRSMVQATNDHLDSASEHITVALSESRKQEDMAADLLGTLHEQRTQMESMKDKTVGIKEDMKASNSLMGEISRRLMREKLLATGVVVVVVLALMFTLYLSLGGSVSSLLGAGSPGGGGGGAGGGAGGGNT